MLARSDYRGTREVYLFYFSFRRSVRDYCLWPGSYRPELLCFVVIREIIVRVCDCANDRAPVYNWNIIKLNYIFV